MISYIGGKSVIGKWIRNFIPTNIETYVEPFGGMFWVWFCLEDKYPNLKNVVYNDFNQLNWNLFKNVRGSNYKEFGMLLNEVNCQSHGKADSLEDVEKFRNTFNSYQKEIFADDFKITESNSIEVAMKYTFVLTQIFSGSTPEKSKYIDYKGKYKPKFRTFREKLTTDRYDKFQKQLEKITLKVFKIFVKDPSNFNKDFKRVRIRKLIENLKNEGLDENKLILTIKNLKTANNALDFYANQNIKNNLSFVLNKKKATLNLNFFLQPDEVIMRSLNIVMRKISKKYYPPRGKSTNLLIKEIKSHPKFKKMTLGGCLFQKINQTIIISKESG